MHVVIVEEPEISQVIGPSTLEGCRAAVREHATHKHQATIEQIETAANAVESWCIEGTDISYAIHKLESVNRAGGRVIAILGK